MSWKRFQFERPTPLKARKMFPAPRCCVLCGEVSGNLEVIDFDDKGSQYAAFMESVEEQECILQKCFFERSPSGGYHIAYRCTERVETSQKLACKTDGGTLIETRGEGGLFLCAPSDGYETMSEFELDEVGTLDAIEREFLLNAARALDQRKQAEPKSENVSEASDNNAFGLPFSEPELPAPVKRCLPCSQTPENLPAWEDFNQNANLRDVLTQAGWKPEKGGTGGNENWTRPGKKCGVSATLKIIDGMPMFHVFSSNAVPFSPGKSYTPFQVYAELYHCGNHSNAAADLRKNGWGKDEKQKYDFSDLTCSGKKHEAVNMLDDNDEMEDFEPVPHVNPVSPSIPEHLYDVPGMLSDAMEYCAHYAPRKQRPFALATALNIVSISCNQQYASPRGVRGNIYTLAVGPTGCGKEFGRMTIKNIFDQMGMSEIVRETYASLPGLQNDLRGVFNPRLWLMDEMGRTLQALNSKNSNTSAKELWPGLLRLYTSSNSSFKPTIKGDVFTQGGQYADIKYPFLSLYGTSTPEQLLNAMTWDVVSDGFLGRVMIFEAEKQAPGYIPTLSKMEVPEYPDGPAGIINECMDILRKPMKEPPQAHCLEETQESYELFEDLLIRQTRAQESDSTYGPLWARCEEQAEKLALLYAFSRDRHPVCDESAARWGCELSEYLTRRRISMACDWIAVNEFDAKQKEILRYMKERGGTVSKSELARRFRYWDSKSRDSIMENMIKTGVIFLEFKKGTTNKKVVFSIKYY